MMSDIWSLSQKDLCSFFTNYEPFPMDNFDIEELLDSPNLKLIKGDGKVYFGQLSRQKR